MKKVLLLGGSGFIGRNLKEYFQLKRTDIHLETPTRQELDLLDEQSVKRYLKPDILMLSFMRRFVI